MADELKTDSLEMFEELKNIRINKKLELGKIAEKTKINIKYLQAIEAGNLKEIPEIYDKLFFQTYLSALKIRNQEKYFDQYRELRKEKKTDYTTTIQKIRSVKSDPVRFSKTKQLYLIIPVLIVVIIIIFLAVNSKILQIDDSKNIREVSVREAASEMESIINPKSDSVVVAQAAEDSSVITVELSTINLTWLRCVSDRADTSEYLLKAGEKINLDADSTMVFLVGNAAGISFTVNGKEEGILGSEDQVISYLKITKDGIISKQLKNVVKENTTVDSSSTI